MSTIIIAFLLATGHVYARNDQNFKIKRASTSPWEVYSSYMVTGIFFFALAGLGIFILHLFLVPASGLGADKTTLEQQNLWQSDFTFLNNFFNTFTNKMFSTEANKCQLNNSQNQLMTLSFSAVGLSWIISKIKNALKAKAKKTEEILQVLEHDALERIVYKNAIDNHKLNSSNQQWEFLQFVLDNNKVYIGICSSFDIRDKPLESISIVPMISGYIDKDNHKLNILTNYFDYYYGNEIFKDILNDLLKTISLQLNLNQQSNGQAPINTNGQHKHQEKNQADQKYHSAHVTAAESKVEEIMINGNISEIEKDKIYQDIQQGKTIKQSIQEQLQIEVQMADAEIERFIENGMAKLFDRFIIAIKKEKIIYVRKFDPEIYEKFNSYQ